MHIWEKPKLCNDCEKFCIHSLSLRRYVVMLKESVLISSRLVTWEKKKGLLLEKNKNLMF